MTDQERAREAIERAKGKWRARPKPTLEELEKILARDHDPQATIAPDGVVTGTASYEDEIVTAFVSALSAVREEERERCAKVAELPPIGHRHAG